MHRFFIAYGLLVLGFYSFAEFRGWSPTDYSELKNVPKSIRDNPGAYRSMYQRYYHK